MCPKSSPQTYKFWIKKINNYNKMDMRDVLIEVKESFIGLLRTTAFTVNVTKTNQSGKRFNNNLENLNK